MIEAPSLHESIACAGAAPGSRQALEFTRYGAFSASEILECASRAAGGFRRLGVRQGDRVVVMAENRPAFVFSCLACSMLGAIAVPLNTALLGDPLVHVLRQTRPRLAVVGTDFEQAVDRACAETGTRPLKCLVTPADQPWGETSFAELMQHGALDEYAEVAVSDPLLIMYTSGTTGPSKGVVWSHGTTLRVAGSAIRYLEYTTEDTVYTTLPQFHGNALALSTFGGLLAGARVVVGHRFSARNFWSEVAGCAATVTNMLGSMAQILWRQEPNPVEREHALRLALVIPCPPGEQRDEFEERFGVSITEAYGLTDIGMVLWSPPGEHRAGSCGKPTADWECELVDEHDEPVAPGEVGELVARPRKPFAAPLGYWRMPEATVESWRNLWMHSGDLMTRDDDGWFYFVDRSKDSIRRRGENVSSFEVEQVLSSLPGVEECAVYGVPSDVMEDEVMAAVVPVDGAVPDFADLARQCAGRLPYFAVPRYFRRLDALPRTASQKVRKADLKDEGVTPDAWDRESGGARP